MAFLENRIFCIWGLYDVSSQLDQVMHLHSEYHIRDSVFLTHHTRIQILSITQSRCSMISYSHYFFPFLLVIWGEGSLLKTIQWPLSLSKYPLRFFFQSPFLPASFRVVTAVLDINNWVSLQVSLSVTGTTD